MLNGWSNPEWEAPDPRPYYCLRTAAAKQNANPQFGYPLVGGSLARFTLTGIAERQAYEHSAEHKVRGWRVPDSGRAELFGDLPLVPYNATRQADANGGWTGPPPIPIAAFDRRVPIVPGDNIWKPAAAVYGWRPQYHFDLDC